MCEHRAVHGAVAMLKDPLSRTQRPIPHHLNAVRPLTGRIRFENVHCNHPVLSLTRQVLMANGERKPRNNQHGVGSQTIGHIQHLHGKDKGRGVSHEIHQSGLQQRSVVERLVWRPREFDVAKGIQRCTVRGPLQWFETTKRVGGTIATTAIRNNLE